MLNYEALNFPLMKCNVSIKGRYLPQVKYAQTHWGKESTVYIEYNRTEYRVEMRGRE